MATGAPAGSPCGACRFLRRKCAPECVFAPYFCSEQAGPARFAAIHKVFGASNLSKLLLHVPPADRCEAVVAIAYEAQARLRDPVYGCVAHIFALQQQVASLQVQLMQVKAQVLTLNLQTATNVRSQENHHHHPLPLLYSSYPSGHSSVSPQSSLDSVVDCNVKLKQYLSHATSTLLDEGASCNASTTLLQEAGAPHGLQSRTSVPIFDELGHELQDLALIRMIMRN